ncbi:MAG: class A beta-lactamase [Pseudomonadota bacterium]
MTTRRSDLTRRAALGSGLALGLSACLPPDQSPLGRLQARFRIIEAEADGTLGAELFDTANGLSVGINRNRRFGHCSSFKLSLAAMVLAQDASGEIDADQLVRWSEDDMIFFSPFTEQRLAQGATLRELAKATQTTSDNTAANVLLRELGGPAALTGFWRSMGDEVSRLDRIEPALNNVPATEIRDTTTPSAMARTVAKLVYGDVLPEAERATLKQWMVETGTGLRRVRAGLPEKWLAGDKTGTSLWPGTGSLYVDIGFAEPPSQGEEARGPITFATYFRTREPMAQIDPVAERALARVGDLLADFGEKDDWFPF